MSNLKSDRNKFKKNEISEPTDNSKPTETSTVAIFIIMAVILSVILLLTGCSTGGKSDPSIDIYATTEGTPMTYTLTNHPVKEPNEIKYLVPNALSEETMEKLPSVDSPRESEGKNIYVYYAIYSGLKSQEVLDKVNAKVQSLLLGIDSLLNPDTIVPFRGIKAVIDDKSSRTSSSISVYTSFSANNLLSIRGYGSGTYQTHGSAINEERWVSLSRGLNLDLNTGESVPLEALFIDGYDYESVINTSIVEQIDQNNLMDEAYLGYTFLPARLTQPFDGINHDQSYCLDPFNLTIIIDANDPRFDSGFEQVTFTISLSEFGDNLAMDARYFDSEHNLFVDETEKRMLPVWRVGAQGLSKNFEGSFEGGKWTLMAYNQSDRLNDVYDAMIEASKAYLNALKMEGKDNYAEMTLSKVAIGRFITFSKNLWISQGNDYVNNVKYSLYDAFGKKLTLKDLFIEGFDYEAVIKKRVIERMLENRNFTDAEFENAFALKQFTLYESNLTIILPVTNEGMAPELLEVYIPFEIFGVHNMTIFD